MNYLFKTHRCSTTRVLTLAALLLAASIAAADDAELFALTRSGIFIIQVTDRETRAQGVLGSGFLVGDALIATNYHVISRHLLHPDVYALRLETKNQDKIPLRVVAVDVVHDLALVAPLENQLDFSTFHQFEFADAVPPQGAKLLAIGNPYDIGVSIVPGTYNGPVRHSYQQRLHFTGALNPGMSGGPAVDEQGRIVGINVAGAGNMVSFLVPGQYLQELLEQHQQSGPLDYELLAAKNRTDLAIYQQQLVADLLSQEWEMQDFGPVRVPGQFADYVTCAGNSSDPDSEQRYTWHSVNCGVYDRIFLSPELDTGTIEMDYYWYSTKELGALRFYQVLDGQDFSAFNRVGKDDVTPFECHDDITRLEALTEEQFKIVFCVRAYMDYAGFYDVLLAAQSLLANDESVTIHYTLAGVTLETARKFNDAFVGAIQWK